MNLRDLDYILAVAELRHFGQAAERCNISQPTLSNQIRKLEEFLGVALFERTNRSVSVTEIGRQVIEQARIAREAARAMQSIAQAHRDPFADPVRLGAIPTLSPYLAPAVLPSLAADERKLKLIWSEDVTDSLIARLQRYELDAALIATPVSDDQLETWPLFDEPFWLAYQRGHRFAEATGIDAGVLIEENLLLLSEGHCLRDQVSPLCRAQPPGETGDFRASSLETLLSLVGAGYGCTLVPALAIGSAALRNVEVRRIDVPEAKRTVRLVFRRSSTRREALACIAGLIRENLPETVSKLAKPKGL
jgi:LysR family hydrogen peroxide-inducible transcriptional activator